MPVISESERDEIFVNLSVLSKLPINTRLDTSGVYIDIENATFIPQAMRRWARGDNRNEMISKLNRIVTKAVNLVQNDPDDNELMDHLESASKGILNLKETYSTCIQTRARLDIILDKIGQLCHKAQITVVDC